MANKANNIRKRLESGGIYVESNGTTWQHVIDLTPSQMFAGQVVVAKEGTERIYSDIAAALKDGLIGA